MFRIQDTNGKPVEVTAIIHVLRAMRSYKPPKRRIRNGLDASQGSLFIRLGAAATAWELSSFPLLELLHANTHTKWDFGKYQECEMSMSHDLNGPA